VYSLQSKYRQVSLLGEQHLHGIGKAVYNHWNGGLTSFHIKITFVGLGVNLRVILCEELGT